MDKVAISRCLLGEKCRYDGKSKPNPSMFYLIGDDRAVKICPESEGGLKIPRSPAQIVGGDGLDVLNGHAKVLSESGEDYTEQFILGSKKVLKRCIKKGVTKAYLKSKSPSCGAGQIYKGLFDGGLINGDGVLVALLKQNGIIVIKVD